MWPELFIVEIVWASRVRTPSTDQPMTTRMIKRWPTIVFDLHGWRFQQTHISLFTVANDDHFNRHSHWLLAGLRLWLLCGHSPSHRRQLRTRVAVFTFLAAVTDSSCKHLVDPNVFSSKTVSASTLVCEANLFHKNINAGPCFSSTGWNNWIKLFVVWNKRPVVSL